MEDHDKIISFISQEDNKINEKLNRIENSID